MGLDLSLKAGKGRKKPVRVKRVTLELFRTILAKPLGFLKPTLWACWDEKSRFQEESLKLAYF